MEQVAFVCIAVFIFIFGLSARLLHHSLLTPPMLFVTVGFLMSSQVSGLLVLPVGEGLMHLLLELTLILVLFTDAAKIDLRTLRKQFHIPVRLLGIGMPLTIIGGAFAASYLFPELSFWEAAVVATILAPTDAALGEAVVSNQKVPLRIRQALNVESGLNDGLALPLVLVSLALAAVGGGNLSATYWGSFVAKQLLFGPLVGIATGFFGGRLIQLCRKRNWIDDRFEQMTGMGVALSAFALAELVGGNGFISAFVAGMTLGNTARNVCACIYDFSFSQGQLLGLLVFMLFGNVMVLEHLGSMNWTVVVYGLLSLTLLRMVPVALSLIGLGLNKRTKLFIGWFGPRGLASILFGMLVLKQTGLPHQNEIFLVVVTTVLLSVFLHGVTAYPMAMWYARCTHRILKDDRPEFSPVEDMTVIARKLV